MQHSSTGPTPATSAADKAAIHNEMKVYPYCHWCSSHYLAHHMGTSVTVLIQFLDSVLPAIRLPGKPQMNVVLSTRSGILDLSFCKSFMVCSWGGLFMLSSVRLLMCCSGMSMYLHTCVHIKVSGHSRLKTGKRNALPSCISSCDYAGVLICPA